MGKFSAYKLPLKSLGEGVHEFDYKLTKQFFSDMENADVRNADLDVHLTVNAKHDNYALSFTITGTVTLLCDRCLDDLVLPIDARYSIDVEYGDDYNDDSDNLLVIPASDNYLNVSYMIYDTVILAIPIKHVHPLGKCNRAMSAVLRKHRAVGVNEDTELEEELMDEMDNMESDGTNTGSDPRWNALSKLSTDGEYDSDN